MANNLSANDFQLGVQVVPKTDQLNNEFKKISQTASLNVNVKINDQSFKKVNKVVETYSNNLGKTYQQTTILNQANEVLYSSTTKLNEKFKPFNKEVKQSSQNLSETAKTAKQASGSITNLGEVTSKAGTQAKSLGQSFGDIVTKVGKFYLATKPIQMMQQAFDEAIETVKEFDDAVTEFKKVSDLSGESLDDYTQKLGELGKTVARTRSDMVASSTEFVKSGYSEEDAAQLARIAELYRNIADEAISSGDSANFIISQMKAFSNDTETFALHTINAINNVSNNMAVSSSDISTALSKTSSAMGALGNTYEQTVALVTSGTEIMQGQASKVARGLRTIGNNIANAAQGADTLEISVQGVTKQIDLLDSTTGDMRSTFDIMQDIFTSGWNDMTNAEQQALAISLAGKLIFASTDLIAGKITKMLYLLNSKCLKPLIPNYNSNVVMAKLIT